MSNVIMVIKDIPAVKMAKSLLSLAMCSIPSPGSKQTFTCLILKSAIADETERRQLEETYKGALEEIFYLWTLDYSVNESYRQNVIDEAMKEISQVLTGTSNFNKYLGKEQLVKNKRDKEVEYTVAINIRRAIERDPENPSVEICKLFATSHLLFRDKDGNRHPIENC